MKSGHIFHCTHTEKPLGSSGNIAVVLKSVARELAPTWEPNYQVSVDNHTVLAVWKTAHAEHPNSTFCSSVLTSVTMKSLETITLEHLSKLSCTVS